MGGVYASSLYGIPLKIFLEKKGIPSLKDRKIEEYTIYELLDGSTTIEEVLSNANVDIENPKETVEYYHALVKGLNAEFGEKWCVYMISCEADGTEYDGEIIIEFCEDDLWEKKRTDFYNDAILKGWDIEYISWAEYN